MKSLFSNKSKKNIGAFLVFIFLFNLFFNAVYVKKAEAYFATEATQIINESLLGIIAGATSAIEGVTVPVISPSTAATAATTKVATKDQLAGNWWHRAVEWVKTSWYQISDTITQKSQLLKEYVLDPLFWSMANVIIDQFGDAIVNWIRNGFEGSPMFLSDPEGFFSDMANQASGAIIDDLNMEWLCDPLGKLRIDLDFFLPGTDRAKYRCTFNDVAGNFKDIAGRKDLSDWIDINVNMHEQNIVRLYGSDYRQGGLLMWLFTAQKKNNDLGRTIQTASDAFTAARVSVNFGKFNLFKNGGFLGMRKCVEYEDIPLEEGGLMTTSKCLKYVDTTPGQLVQDQLNQAAGGDLKRLHIADEVDEIIGALASTMVGWMLTGGNDGGGILGYDKDAGYSASNRDHFGALNKSKTLTKKKTDISGQIVLIKDGNDQHDNAIKKYRDWSSEAESNKGIVLAKLKCIRATSTNDIGDIYDDSDCLGASEEIKNVKLTPEQIAEITVDIDKIESDAWPDDSGKYEDETAVSARTAELLDEFENKVMMATALEDIDVITDEYCYSYDESKKTGTICGLYADKEGNTEQETHTTRSEEEATAINKEAMSKVPENKTAELKYVCILDKYVPVKGLMEGECKGFESSSLSAKKTGSSSSE